MDTNEPTHEQDSVATDANNKPAGLAGLTVTKLLGQHINRRAATGFAIGAVSFTASLAAIADYLRSDDAPTDRSARITEMHLITWETLGEFVDRLTEREHESLESIAPNLEAFTPEQREIKGVVLQYHIELVGFHEETLELSWSLYDAQSRRLLEDHAFRGQPGFPEKYVQAYSQVDQRTGELWIPAPLVPGHYYGNIEVWDMNRNRSHSHLSPEFSVKRDGSIDLS